ncbi:related to DCD1 - deoxycytidylate deaminase [Melanopsichium pennsylvanicum]|uniref:dCMP deaminase n=1 Tax=Melanopsichium pennsylvanicum TaxID=63383 RepID=A0AAJ4XPZ1_9BASI|nr:related to DCD1 - deoxycytidylate deaminase [Melanopsichium pennsylvanicum]
MLIALIGTPAAGKASVAHYLATNHGFTVITLSNDQSTPLSAFSSNGEPLKATLLPNSKVMLDYVTDRWNTRFVTIDLNTVGDLEAFIKRPFFLCVEVGGPLLMRWERWGKKHGQIGLEKFARLDDGVSYGKGSNRVQTVANGSENTEPLMLSSPSSSSLIGGNGIVDNLSNVSLTNNNWISLGTSKQSSSTSSGLTSLRRYVHLSINNDHSTIQALHSHLENLNLTSQERLRPCWDTYFLKLCNLASLRSNCMKRRVGAVLVSSNRILSTGYNGTPSGLRNCNQGGCSRCNNTLEPSNHLSASSSRIPGALDSSTSIVNKPDLVRAGSSACGQNLEECLCLHAEENALLEAGRQKTAGATMYCNTCPCLRCAVKIIQTGIKKVVYQLEYSMDQRTKAIFKEADVDISQFHLDT